MTCSPSWKRLHNLYTAVLLMEDSSNNSCRRSLMLSGVCLIQMYFHKMKNNLLFFNYFFIHWMQNSHMHPASKHCTNATTMHLDTMTLFCVTLHQCTHFNVWILTRLKHDNNFPIWWIRPGGRTSCFHSNHSFKSLRWTVQIFCQSIRYCRMQIYAKLY